jgi:uncharacterized protein
MDFIYLFYLLLFLVAFLYASVGHGGASGYLALMAIFSIAPDVMKPTALLLNLFVSLTSFIQFYGGGNFKWNIFWPLLLAAPMAYIGGRIEVDAFVYKKILGLLLLIPVVRFLFFSNIKVDEPKELNKWLAVGIGGGIGFLSGLIGIGGGIILSPVLLMLKWANMKQAAAVSALFIFVNSLTGLRGQMERGIHFTPDMYLYVVIAFAGGLFGAYYGSLKFNQNILKNALAFVLLIAVYKLLLTNA